MSKNRLPYRFTLTLPEAFTVSQLMRRGLHPKYITARKRIEKALLDGTIVEAAQFRAKATRGRFQKVYVKADVENVQLVIEKAFAGKGELVDL
jgi:uncharacterized protein YqjF (DUF2071 family)